MEKHFNRVNAAAYVQQTYGFPCSPKTLAKLACTTRSGPKFRRVGMKGRSWILYPKSELDEWAKARFGPLVSSTQEADAAMPEKARRVLQVFQRSVS